MKHTRIVSIAFTAIACLWIASCGQMGSDGSSVLVNQSASEFSLKSVNNTTSNSANNSPNSSPNSSTVKLSELKGQVVVLDFWATWCPPCRESLPNLNRLGTDATLAARGLKVIGINAQEEAQTVEGFLNTHHYTLQVALDTDGAVAHAYHVDGYPTTVIVGRDGLIKNVFVGFDPQISETQLNEAIEKALGEPKPGA